MGGSKHDPNKALWLDAWHDPVSGIKAYSQCLRLADLNGDGDWRLLVADSDKKLKVCPRASAPRAGAWAFDWGNSG